MNNVENYVQKLRKSLRKNCEKVSTFLKKCIQILSKLWESNNFHKKIHKFSNKFYTDFYVFSPLFSNKFYTVSTYPTTTTTNILVRKKFIIK